MSFCHIVQYGKQMEKNTVLLRQIVLPPHFLGANVRDSLGALAKKEYEGKCTPDDGYIMSIQGPVKILRNIISQATNNIIYTIEIPAKTLKPVIGEIYSAVFERFEPSRGAYFLVLGRMELFVNAKKCEDHKAKLVKGSKLNLVITDMQFKKRFICLADFAQP